MVGSYFSCYQSTGNRELFPKRYSRSMRLKKQKRYVDLKFSTKIGNYLPQKWLIKAVLLYDLATAARAVEVRAWTSTLMGFRTGVAMRLRYAADARTP